MKTATAHLALNVAYTAIVTTIVALLGAPSTATPIFGASVFTLLWSVDRIVAALQEKR